MIKKLNSNTVNKIAAGEVVERPLSVVKELVENSLDAQAANIEITIKDNPAKYIEIKDDGIGIPREELNLAFEKHATSKINNVQDLMKLNSLGFRGEALPSISSISYLTAISKYKDEDIGAKIVFDGGNRIKFEDANRKTGTTIKVEKLFFNVPVRKKYLKSLSYEMRLIKSYIGKTGLAFTDKPINFKLKRDNKTYIHYTEYDELLDRIEKFYGEEIADSLMYFEGDYDFYSFHGYITSQDVIRKNSTEMNFFVNNRLIENRRIIYTVKNALNEVLQSREYPYLFLFLEIDPAEVDMNVHPQKKEIRIKNEKLIYKNIYRKIKGLFTNINSVSNIDSNKTESKSDNNSRINNKYKTSKSKNNYIKEKSRNLFSSIETIKEIGEDNKENLKLFDYRYQGMVFSRYLLFISKSEILFIDFHALNERIFYDKIKKEGIKEYISHIIPESLKLSKNDYELVIDNKEMFKNLGIKIRDFGDETIVVETVPKFKYGKQLNPKKIVHNILENFEVGSKNNPYKYIIADMACKASFKTGDKLTNSDIKELIKYIEEGGMSLTCPHGRPVIKKLEKNKVDRWFKR